MRKDFLSRCSHRRVTSEHGRTNYHCAWVTCAAAIGLLVLAALAGCSPYPMYTHRPAETTESGGAPKTGNGAAAEPQGKGLSKSARDRQDNERPWERPGVDPAIFSRVVDLYVGLPYKKGGDDQKGFDCSHLVKAVYLDYSGTRLPASTRALYQLPEDVTREELVVGDLVFFSFDDITISHVGIYMGGGRFMHASESRGVIMSSLSDPDFRDAYKGARRVL